MNVSLPKPADADQLQTNDTRDLTFGIYDILTDHHHCHADVVLAPASEDGEPDWARADPANIRKLPADE
ncbi:hypothetical protein [Bradyrhizobium sp. DASA03007]|uniref:hypothetical protein n=1 Tax=unclassified Bradyrhizobium TaxID=2631580 RepID=UPI003F70EA93